MDSQDYFFSSDSSQAYYAIHQDLMNPYQNFDFDENEKSNQALLSSSQQLFFENSSLENERSSETHNQTSHSETINNQAVSKHQNSFAKKSKNIQKTKPIQKARDKNQIKKLSEDSEESSNSPKKTGGNKSKYNNMGGFLIGSVSDILNSRGKSQFSGGFYHIEIQGFKIQISKYDQSYQQNLIDVMKKLKRQIRNLPRKQGAKRDLFKLINTYPRKDSEQKKVCKKLLRLELIHSLKEETWLKNHVLSREFKPSNDENGTKKQERHDAYLTYLTGIRQALIKKDQLPKRLNL